jgi:putative inorganic carbon (HCO3(-)) transporter
MNRHSSSSLAVKSNTITIRIAIVGIILSLTVGMLIAGVSNTKYLLLAVVGLIAFIVTFIRLELGVMAMIIILYSQTHLIVGDRYGIPDIVQYLIILLVISMGTRWFFYTSEIPQSWMRVLFLIFFYCFVGLASVFYADHSNVAMNIAIDTLKSGTIALIIALVLTKESSWRLAIWALLIVGIILGTISVIQFVLGTYDNDYGGYALAGIGNIAGAVDDYRTGGPVGDPNYYAQMILVMVPIALDRMWNEKRGILRFFAGWALGVCAFTVILTYSRGGFISMIIMVLAWLAISHRGQQLRYLMAVVVIALLLIYVLPPRFTERMSTLTEFLPGFSSSTGGVAQDSSLRGRSSEMLVALKMFADHPVLGVGLGNYPFLYQKYARFFGLELRSEVRQAHDLYLEVVSETGLLGFFSFGLLLWGMFSSIWRAQQSLERKGLTSISNMVAAYAFGLLGFLIAAFFLHAVYFRNFWVLAGIALAIPRMAEVEIESADKRVSKIL